MNDQRIKILIADNESGIRQSLAWILESEGYDVVTCTNGFESVEAIKKNACDFALLDIQLPIMSGIEAFAKIQKISPKTIIIFMTAYPINVTVRTALREGAYACIEKPFEMEEMIKTIKMLKCA
ncbi:MAG: response regulator [Endomicrobiales bacterium]|jgi:DNA-binding NtrC family response regulator